MRNGTISIVLTITVILITIAVTGCISPSTEDCEACTTTVGPSETAVFKLDGQLKDHKDNLTEAKIQLKVTVSKKEMVWDLVFQEESSSGTGLPTLNYDFNKTSQNEEDYQYKTRHNKWVTFTFTLSMTSTDSYLSSFMFFKDTNTVNGRAKMGRGMESDWVSIEFDKKYSGVLTDKPTGFNAGEEYIWVWDAEGMAFNLVFDPHFKC